MGKEVAEALTTLSVNQGPVGGFGRARFFFCMQNFNGKNGLHGGIHE